MAKEEIIILIDIEIADAAHDIVNESGQSLSALVEDALKKHPDVAERIIYLRNKR